MKILMAPVGIYIGRVLTGISETKPDRVVLFTSKQEPDSDYTKEWSVATAGYAEGIVEKVSFFYNESDIDVVSEELGNYSRMLEVMVEMVMRQPEAEFLVDVTSARRGFEMAAIALGMFFDNVRCFYTPPKNPLMPGDYPEKIIHDKGGEIQMITTPRVDFSDLQHGPLKEILVTLGSEFGGMSETFVNLLRAMDWEENRSNVIRLSKMIKKLEKRGCVETERSGREKSVELTPLGRSLSSALRKA